jgi:hypothetical protein
MRDGSNEKRMHLTEKNVLEGSHPAQLDPILFYRIAKPVTKQSLDKLDCFNASDYFKREELADG